MTEEQISDLKLFMTTTVRNEVNAALEEKLEEKLEAKLETKLEAKLEAKFEEKLAPIRQDIKDLTEFVQDAITTSNDANQEQLDDHEVRIARLEKRTA